jgi:hypothetical protein
MAAANGAPTSFRAHGLHCVEEVAALRHEVGPVGGGALRLPPPARS